MSEQDPILDKARQLRAAGATIDEVKQYLASKGYDTGDEPPPPRRLSRTAPAADASAFRRPGTDRSGDFGAVYSGADDLAYKTLAAEANLIRGIKPLAMIQTGARALARGQSYGEAKADLEAADESLPPAVRGGIRIAGATPATMLAPGSTIPQMMASGALFGAAEGMTDDPSVSAGEAVGRMAGSAGAGAALSGLFGGAVRLGEKGVKLNRLRKRVKDAPTLGEDSFARNDAIRQADDALYGAAEKEIATAGGTSPEVQQFLQHPRVKPWADEIRESLAFQGKPASDGEIVLALHRELSAKEGPLISKITGTQTGQAIPERLQGDIATIKEMARKAMSDGPNAIAPSFRPAVATHAAGRQAEGQAVEGAGHARNLMSGKKPSLKKLRKETDEAAMRFAGNRNPQQAEDALTGALAAGKEAFSGFDPLRWAVAGSIPGGVVGGLPGTGLGALSGMAVGATNAAGRGVGRLNRLSPFVDALDTQAGNAVQQPLDLQTLLRALGLTTAVTPP